MKLYFWVMLLLLVIKNSVVADFFNNRNIIHGEKAAMMGGAFTAIADDASAALYNPAGLSEIGKSSISMTANALTLLSLSRSWKENSDSTETKLNSFDMIPTTFSVLLSKDNFAFALSVFQMDMFEFTAIDVRSSGLTGRIEISNTSYFIGTSFAYKFSKYFSLGVSGFYHLYKGELVNTDDSPFGYVKVEQNDIQSGGIVPLIGLLFKPSDKMTFGIKYSHETIWTNGYNTYTLNNIDGDNTRSNGEVKGVYKAPKQINLGIAWGKKDAYTLSIEGIYYFKTEYSAPHEILHTREADRVHTELAHFDLSLGVEYFIVKYYAIRAGLFTNTSSASDSDITERVDYFGASLGVGYKRDGLSAGIGLSAMYGESNWQQDPQYPDVFAKWKGYKLSIIVGASSAF